MILAELGTLLRLGMRNLVGYPLRTLLTILGVVIGVGAVIAMMAMGAGAEHELLQEIGRLGINNIIVNSVKPPEKSDETSSERLLRYGVTFKDERLIRETIPDLDQVLPVAKKVEPVWWGSKRVTATMYAVQPQHMDLFGLSAVRGRNIASLDGVGLKRVCVIRSGLLQALGIFEDPIGMHLRVGEHYYQVVGVLGDEEFLGYAAKALDVDSKTSEIYVPYETVYGRLGTVDFIQRSGSRETIDVELNQVVVSVEDLDDVVVAARMLKRVLEANHEDQDYEMVVPLEVLEQRRQTQQTFNFFLIAIASISLVVGGIGIANIMLATVTERTREIGIRRALGAKRRDIMAQFLTETTVVSLLGGIIGVGAGFGFSYLLSALFGWKAIVIPSSIALALGISMAVGIASGIFPARRAAMLDPIAALRHE